MNATRTMLVVGLILSAGGPGRADLPAIDCTAVNVPVTVAGVPDAYVHGELCLPPGPPPATVQLLVHSTLYNLRSWDTPQREYSYAAKAVAAGYATFNVDRFGTGRSTKPASHLVTVDTVTDTLHQVIVALRAGGVGGHAFTKVVWVGSSFGAAYGWVNASKNPSDIDAYVLTGILHYTKPSFMMEHAFPSLVSVCEEPSFRHLGLDCGYATNRRGTKGALYYYPPGAAPGMIEGVDDGVMRDVISLPLLAESVARLGGILDLHPPVQYTPMPAETDPARSITVPTLIVIGDRDNIFCGPPDGLDCSEAAIRAHEQPYYTVVPDIYLARDSGHAQALHLSAPQTAAAKLSWIDAKVGAR
jgi:pimeloyl-ACP methyl ester carboxylesterase